MLELAILAILFVKSDGTGQYPTIQAAVDAATDGDEIHLSVFGSGPFEGPGNCLIDLQGKAIKIKSYNDIPQYAHIGMAYPPVLGPIFILDQGEGRDTILESLYFSTCSALPDGPSAGVISVSDSSPTIKNCTFNGCGTGPSIYSLNSDPLIMDCYLWENYSPIILIDDGPKCIEIWTSSYDGDIETVNGGCYRAILEAPEDQGGTIALPLVPASWGKILSAYRD